MYFRTGNKNICIITQKNAYTHRQTQIGKDRQTDRQTLIGKDRQTQIGKDRQIDRHR